MLFQLRKENIELNDEYNRIVNEKARFEIEYQRMKKRVKKFEEEKKEFENRESLEMFVESIRNISNMSDSILISDFITSKKLLDSSIFIDEKNSNIEN
jgi:predicted nuclease with TOPRIM domain